MLHRLDPQKFNIIAIQEPYLDQFQNTCANQHWYTVYPREHYVEPGGMRLVILMSRRILADAWTQVEIGSSDITAVQMCMRRGPLLIVNMYNDNTNSDSVHRVEKHMRRMGRERSAHGGGLHVLWLGDFNSHHPLWDEPRNSHLFTRTNLDRAQEVIEVIAKYNLQMILPKGVLTLQALLTGNLTRPDNVFASDSLVSMVVECRTVPEEWPTRSDHFPIDIVVKVGADVVMEPAKSNFRATDWQVVREEMAIALCRLDMREEINGMDEFNARLHALTRAITGVIDRTVPRT